MTFPTPREAQEHWIGESFRVNLVVQGEASSYHHHQLLEGIAKNIHCREIPSVTINPLSCTHGSECSSFSGMQANCESVTRS
ncbi:hypothetical protein CsatB_016276 [Cannabis sativa]